MLERIFHNFVIVPAIYLHESIVYNPTEFFGKLQIKLHDFGMIRKDGAFCRFKKRKIISPLNVDNVDTLFPISAKGSITCSRVSTFY